MKPQNNIHSKYGCCLSRMHWNPVVRPVPENSTVTLLFLPMVTPLLVLSTAQNVSSLCTRILFRITALSSLTGSQATTRSLYTPGGMLVRRKKPEEPGYSGRWRGRERKKSINDRETGKEEKGKNSEHKNDIWVLLYGILPLSPLRIFTSITCRDVWLTICNKNPKLTRHLVSFHNVV